eukprot:121244-Alexandrium_andersonii.AAC.1
MHPKWNVCPHCKRCLARGKLGIRRPAQDQRCTVARQCSAARSSEQLRWRPHWLAATGACARPGMRA